MISQDQVGKGQILVWSTKFCRVIIFVEIIFWRYLISHVWYLYALVLESSLVIVLPLLNPSSEMLKKFFKHFKHRLPHSERGVTKDLTQNILTAIKE